jgi:hypothetical protein
MKKTTLYDRLKPEYLESITKNAKKYPKGTQKVVDTLKSKTEATQLTIEEALDLGAFSFEDKATPSLRKQTQHAVYAFAEQYFNQEQL